MIEIPGYRILRQLGRGGMATVYLAVQESVQREVALKVMAPTLVGAEFGERFLREARIAARLRHPHVVQVHDVGRSGDWHYIAMEYLGGGPALRRDGPRDVAYALQVTREIASALDYAHRRGVVHRDVKPDNLLLRDDGAAVLTDFGIARAHDSVKVTQAGMIMGTPHYMAPEQATGAATDGRADLYALGVVLHELLLGRVPFDADDWVAVGLMHISAPVPQLPPQFAELQPLLDRMLAKSPDARLQTGAEVVSAIEAIEDRLAERRGEPTRRRSAPIAEAAPSDVLAEPTLGTLDRIPDRPSLRPRRAAAARSRGAGRWLGAAALLLLAAGASAWYWQEPLRAMLPQTRHEYLLEQAGQALLAGRLDDARERYQSARALSPDDARARDGLLQVGEHYVRRAEAAVAERRAEDARAALAAARELGIAGSRLEPLETELRQHSYRETELSELVQRAQAALQEGRIDGGDDSALVLYQRARERAPDSEVVRHGLRETLSRMLARAGERIAAGELDAAEREIDAVAAIEPTHVEIGSRRAQLAEARTRAQQASEQQFAQAEQWRAAGRLIAPAGANARDAYRALLAAAPGDAQAQDGLRRVADALLVQAERAAADFEFERAAAALAEARATVSDHPGLRRTEQRIAELQARHAQFAATTAVDPVRVRNELEAAASAVADGQLVHPPGESAYDRYKAVLRMDPNNADAKAGVAALPAEAQRRFELALGRNELSNAYGYVHALDTLAPDAPALQDMRRRLARSLLGYADERLGRGELQRARDAVEMAAELDAGNNELPALRARLEQAQP